MPLPLTRVQVNVLANLVGPSISAVLGILCVPWYIRLLGMETYGVVAFHGAIVGALGLLDLGLSTAVNRQLACLSGQPHTAAQMRATVRTVGGIYWIIVLVVSVVLFLLAPVLAQRWFRLEHLNPSELTDALQLMAVAICFQWPAVFYSGCLGGLQHQTQLNIISLTGAIVRYPGSILLFVLCSPSLMTYFLAQAAAGGLQTGLTLWAVRRSLPRPDPTGVTESLVAEPIWRFAAGISGIAVTALLLTQIDKFLLSTLLPLDQFGGYMLAATIASGLGIVSGGLYAAALPRLSELAASGIEGDVRAFYHDAAQLLGVLLFPLAAVLVVHAESVIRVWTGNAELAVAVALQVRLLIAGSTLMGVYLIPIALQYAHGWTRLTLTLNIIAVLVHVPLLIVLASYAGGDGAALAWLVLSLFCLVLGPPLMHRNLLRGDMLRWYISDLLLPAIPPFLMCCALALLPLPTERYALALSLILVGCLAGMAAFVSVPVTRRWGFGQLHRLR